MAHVVEVAEHPVVGAALGGQHGPGPVEVGWRQGAAVLQVGQWHVACGVEMERVAATPHVTWAMDGM